mmetsp:Transcript_9805/g.25752  ORF Transcript_9805/g.25752 Transcript_9805/m.25752 type:complete len:298 (-) Transcript_9805:258-1151(-)
MRWRRRRHRKRSVLAQTTLAVPKRREEFAGHPWAAISLATLPNAASRLEPIPRCVSFNTSSGVDAMKQGCEMLLATSRMTARSGVPHGPPRSCVRRMLNGAGRKCPRPTSPSASSGESCWTLSYVGSCRRRTWRFRTRSRKTISIGSGARLWTRPSSGTSSMGKKRLRRNASRRRTSASTLRTHRSQVPCGPTLSASVCCATARSHRSRLAAWGNNRLSPPGLPRCWRQRHRRSPVAIRRVLGATPQAPRALRTANSWARSCCLAVRAAGSEAPNRCRLEVQRGLAALGSIDEAQRH